MMLSHLAQCGTHGVKMAALVLAAASIVGLQANAARCRQPCLSGVCDDLTGACVFTDWGSGMAVDSSQQVQRLGCPNGYYGPDCSTDCPVNCVGSECDQDTGQCTQGCSPGFTGSHCTSVCINGYYGVNCTKPCPEHCQNATCTPQSGVCNDGCVDGFWGSDCSLGIELSRNTPKEKRTFYAHLSAESKSVLLYLLTSRYEHALARAQFEIEQAVQERNNLQHLLED